MISNDIIDLIKNSKSTLGNHFELHYENENVSNIKDYLLLWDYNNDEFEIAGNYFKVFINNVLIRQHE